MRVAAMETNIEYATASAIAAEELAAFYERQGHHTTRDLAKLERMIANSFCFVTARLDGELIGMARGVTDGVHGYLSECKLDPRFQGPACITRKDGRIEHDSEGIAAEMALRVVSALAEFGVDRIHALAYGTEVDFCEEMGFRRVSGMVVLERAVTAPAPVNA
ncbi:MAG TPA: hypothetical protein P5572_09400 [Phycisphaerae bacterium]|nr:hypothetical protein [Phycisphaerales bacterium]HRX85218.1 hypothetical protein [Phycisphaerae bacterium]